MSPDRPARRASPLVPLVCVAVAAGALTLAGSVVLRGGDTASSLPLGQRVDPTWTDVDGRSLAELAEAIAGLQRELAELRLRSDGSRSAPAAGAAFGAAGERAEVPDPDGPTDDAAEPDVSNADLLGTLEDLRRRLARVETLLATPLATAPDVRLDLTRPADVAALRDFASLDDRDHPAAERDLHLRTATEVLDRFGAPTRTGAAQGQAFDMWWNYELEGADGETYTVLGLYFTNGRVLGFHAYTGD